MNYDYNRSNQKSLAPSKSQTAATNYEEFATTPAPSFSMNNGMMTPAVAREVAQIQGQIMMAKLYPRDERQALVKIDQACSRESLASAAVYAYARGGSDIQGPSIRLAETLARAWGNVKYGFEETESNDQESVVRTYAYDMESNTLAERTFSVPHVRHTKNGDYPLTDPRDVYELIANQAARRERACILEIIPPDVVDHALEVCNTTIRQNVKITPETLELMAASFRGFGVTIASIEAFIQRKLEAVTASQYIKLRNIYASLKDGIAKPEDFFDLNAGEEKANPPVQEAISEPGAVVDDVPLEAYGPENFVDEPLEEI